MCAYHGTGLGAAGFCQLQNSEKSREGGRAKRTMPIGDKACSGERLEGARERPQREKRRQAQEGQTSATDQLQLPCAQLARKGRRVKKGARQVDEDSVPVGANEGGDAEERVEQV
jgi:hypothetical protein